MRSGEFEVSLALAAAIPDRLGATPEHLERERERVQTDLELGAAVLRSR